METRKIEINRMDGHAFCTLPNGEYLFGRSVGEVSSVLDAIAGVVGVSCDQKVCEGLRKDVVCSGKDA